MRNCEITFSLGGREILTEAYPSAQPHRHPGPTLVHSAIECPSPDLCAAKDTPHLHLRNALPPGAPRVHLGGARRGRLREVVQEECTLMGQEVRAQALLSRAR